MQEKFFLVNRLRIRFLEWSCDKTFKHNFGGAPSGVFNIIMGPGDEHRFIPIVN